MGCYETIMIPCPRCGERYPAQSKSGPCEMETYTLEEAPNDVVDDVNRHAPFRCDKCAAVFEVELTETRSETWRSPAVIDRVVVLLGPEAKSKYESYFSCTCKGDFTCEAHRA
jgi:hypothetical protein